MSRHLEGSQALTLAVQQQSTTGNSAWGETLGFDFSADCGANDTVLAYGVGLAGFSFAYITDGQADQNFGLLQTTLVPSMIAGTTVYVTAAQAMSDFDNDGPAGGGESVTQVTVIALIGAANDAVRLGNLYNVGASQSGYLPINVGTNTGNYVFMSGFQVQTQDTGVLTGFSASANLGGPPENGDLSVATAINVGDINATGSVDALILSMPSVADGGPSNFDIANVGVDWGSPNHDTGVMTGNFSVSFSSAVTSAAVLINNFNIYFDDNDDWDFCNLKLTTSLDYTSGTSTTVNGSVELQIFATEAEWRNFVSANSSASLSIIAQF